MCDSAEILKKASSITDELLPAKSKYRYEAAFEQLMKWRAANNVETFSENVFLVYFEELSKKYKASTLWSTFSMLKAILNAKENINLGRYMKLQAFLKRKSESYVPKKSKILTEDDFNQFLETAPDEKFLLTKAVVAVGLSGACRREELCNLKVEDMRDFNDAMFIKLMNTKTKTPRSFTVSGGLYTILKKYSSRRPSDLKQSGRFFLNYQQGRCTHQNVGINKIGAMAKQIAEFLSLENPESYTGHCFRRSSATILVNSGSDLLALKRHGGWKSSTVAEGYVDDSIKNKMDISTKIESSVMGAPLEERVEKHPLMNIVSNKNLGKSTKKDVIVQNNMQSTSIPGVNLESCSNVTINIHY